MSNDSTHSITNNSGDTMDKDIALSRDEDIANEWDNQGRKSVQYNSYVPLCERTPEGASTNNDNNNFTPLTKIISLAAKGDGKFFDDNYTILKNAYVDEESIHGMSNEDYRLQPIGCSSRSKDPHTVGSETLTQPDINSSQKYLSTQR